MASGRTRYDFEAAAHLQETTWALATGYQETPTQYRHLRLVFKLTELFAFQKELDYLGDHESSHREQFERRFGTGAEKFVDQKKEGFRDLLTGIAQEFLSEKKFAEITGTATDAESHVTTTTRHQEISHGTSERKFAEVTRSATGSESYVPYDWTTAEHRESSPPDSTPKREFLGGTGTVTDAESYVTTPTEHRESWPYSTSERKSAEVTKAVTDAESCVPDISTKSRRREFSLYGTPERKFIDGTGTVTDAESYAPYVSTTFEHQESSPPDTSEGEFVEFTGTVTDAESYVMTPTERREGPPHVSSERKSAEATEAVTDVECFVMTPTEQTPTEHRASSPHGTSERKSADVTEAITDAESYVTTMVEHQKSSPNGTIRSLSESSESEAYVVLNKTFAEPPVIRAEQMLESLLPIIAKHFLRPLGKGEFENAKPDDKLKALIGGLTRDHFHPCQDIPQRVQSVLASSDIAYALIERREQMLLDLMQKIADHPTLSFTARNTLASTIVIINPDYITPDDLHPNDIHPDEIDPEDEDEDSPSKDLSIAKYFVRMEDVLKHLINRFDQDPDPFETDEELEELCSRVEAIRKGHCYRFSKKRLAKLFKKGLIIGPPLSLVTSSLMAEFGLQMP